MDTDLSSEIRQRLIGWFSENGRAFVWRRDRRPYTVLIAEVLLRKTRAEVVDRFIGGFLTRFPEASTLATVDLRELALLLQPLGLGAQRAYQLRRLGEVLTTLPDGDVPETQEELLALPGVGTYTAAAVLCFAHGRAEALVDTNVARIIVRVYGIARPSRYEARRSPEILAKARGLIGTDSANARSVNWALLDLGAKVCKSRKAECTKCPLEELCSYAGGIGKVVDQSKSTRRREQRV